MNEAMKSSIKTNLYQTVFGLIFGWTVGFICDAMYLAYLGTGMLLIGNLIFAVRCILEVRSNKNKA